jgi:hypothetical protein
LGLLIDKGINKDTKMAPKLDGKLEGDLMIYLELKLYISS